jgi:hypothetical protein
MQHDSGIEHYSHSEKSIKDETVSQARRARRQSRTQSGTPSGDETKRKGYLIFQQKFSLIN